ncbi:MAG: substrate-binding domain-containing protein, partial [Ruminococcaceae bacterium]|nr:substrate-binding domain-containing protein [Oscillospiraceae bacterium]
FDGNYMSSMVRPTLTTMYQDTSAKAAAAIDGLVALMSGSTPEKRDIRIPVRLIERNSVTVIK